MDEKDKEPMDELREFLETQAKEQAAKPPAALPVARVPFLKRHPRLVLTAQLAIIAAAAVSVYSAFPELKSALQPERQVRFGVYDTDGGTEKCIAALWKAAGASGKAGACPVSGLPYKAEGQTIQCPSPEKHGLTALYFSPDKGVAARRDK